ELDHVAGRLLPLPPRPATFATGDVPVEILADHHVGRQLAPGAGDLAIRLLEDRPAALILDLRGPQLPVDLVERARPLPAEDPRDLHPGPAHRPPRRALPLPAPLA